ncbi:hypothetical protein CTEN210_06932 [Chaetoceros tenuissimus]|uniref:CCHC-type domain-containing protein n=1 Tax=Chaetoceros tenuissimus TaxID=426638 RepID=A0AAD3CQS6_9STRA|nr:hypothetical protein CTEN210_06932 [Chaetoceros tenuissimus]
MQRGVTEDWPNGKATLMITSLDKKFGAKAGFLGINLRDKLHAVKWKANGGLAQLIEDMAEVRALAVQLKDKDMTDDDYVAQLVKQVPVDYRVAVAELVASGSKDYDDYKDALENYRDNFNLEGDDEDSDDEKAETALTSTEFNGKCFKCCKKGHRANKCPQKGNGGRGRFIGTCDLCGKRGHKKVDCWEDDANADKRPRNWKKDTAMAGVEIMLCSFVEDMQYDSDESSCFSDMPELIEKPEESSDEESSDDDVPPPLVERGDSSSEYTDSDSEDDASDASEYYHFQGLDIKDCYTYARCDVSKYCHFPSHSAKKCCNYEPDDDSISDYDEVEDPELETSLLTSKEVVDDPYFFIADSGASNDMKITMDGISNKRESKGYGIISANGAVKTPNAIADYDFTQYDKHGRKVQDGKMTDVCVGAGTFNLFSITKRLQAGWKLSGSDVNLTLTKGKAKIVFDQKVKVGSSYLFGTILKPRSEVAAASMVKEVQGPIRVSVVKAHNIFGHLGENDCRAAAKASGYELKRGSFGQCVSCAVAKAKQKSLVGESEGDRSEVSNERIYLDLVTLKPPTGVKVTKLNPIWRIIVDEATRMSFNSFHPKKNAYLEPTCVYLDNWKQNGQPVKYVRMDNAPENKKFIEMANGKEWKLNLTAEMTGANTPQHNGVAERKIATLLGRARATTHNAECDDTARALLGNELVNYCEKIDWLVPIEIGGEVKPRVEHWCGKLPNFAKYLRTWGEAGVVKTRTLAKDPISW